MPAYRSEAEGEVRQAVVEYLRIQRPNARIIHEINSSYGGRRVGFPLNNGWRER